MRDRLIELLKGFSYECRKPCDKPSLDSLTEDVKDCNKCKFEQISDYLLENGVIVPPCKVGDTVYLLIDWGYEKEIEEKEVGAISIQGTNDFSKELWEDFRGGQLGTFADFGKTVFLTREEAEQALRKE